MKVIVKYDTNYGTNLSDSECEYVSEEIANGSYKNKLVFGNEYIIHYMILRMLEGKIDRSNLFFEIEDKEYQVDELGFLIGNVELPRAQLTAKINKLRLDKLNK